jgi:glucoamylase
LPLENSEPAVPSESVVAGVAPGSPGIGPTWSSGTKDMVGCSLGPSRLWFTIGAGIINEVYYPRADIPQIRDLGFIVADGRGFWVEVKRLAAYRFVSTAAGVPAVCIVHEHERFRLMLRVVPCSHRDVLLVEVTLTGDETLRPYVLLAPHLGGTGRDNYAEIGVHHGRRMLWAKQGPFALALAAVDAKQRDAWGRTSAGFVGASDGWQDFAHNGAMTWEYGAAGPGNVALLGELPRKAVIALGFAASHGSAATLAVSALMEPFEVSWERQLEMWRAWHEAGTNQAVKSLGLPPDLTEQVLLSAMVLRVHQDKIYPGSMVASLSVPWGNAHDDLGGYHLVWPRDLVKCALALVELGCAEEPRQILQYLIATQHTDGHWNQNQWLGGKPFWKGIQIDEAVFPVLLTAALASRNELGGIEAADMIRRALTFVARTGPASPQDRWEEDAGLNAFTLTICIIALIEGAEFLDDAARTCALELADYWNGKIEDWISVRNAPFGLSHGVSQYYVRAAPARILMDPAAMTQPIPISNWWPERSVPAAEQIGVDFLHLVRLGLRSHDDAVITGSIKMVDALLRDDTPAGPGWHRYTDDGYGEHEDGSPFDGTGRGRLWPLLTGERGHYALISGEDALPYLRSMAATASAGGMIPEQIWDAADIPARLLHRGKPTGSATPLAWAHAEFIQLAASLHRGHAADRPAAVWRRYQGRAPKISVAFWCEHAPINSAPAGTCLRVCLHASGDVRVRIDGADFGAPLPTRDTGLGLHAAEISLAGLRSGQTVRFDYRVAPGNAWTGTEHAVMVTAA